MSDPLQPVELREGAQWAGRGDTSEVRLEVLGRTPDDFLMVQRVAGVPGYMLRKPFPVEERQLRAAFDPVTPEGEVLDQWQRVRDTLARLADALAVPFDKLDEQGIGGFERAGHLGAFVPLHHLERLLDGHSATVRFPDPRTREAHPDYRRDDRSAP